MTSELARLDAVALAAAIAAGEVSPLEVIEDTARRLERLNPTVNAVIHPDLDAAVDAARGTLPDGPFRGVPMLLKDLWPTEKGRPHHMGVAALRRADHRADVDANITTAYRRAGFVLAGRTNTPELGLVATTEPLAYGPSRNPWNPEHGTGGSSGGAAAAVAAGIVPAANASDGGGSIRIPAAMCGLVGLKPSRGRISMGPLQDEWGNSVQHVVSRTVRDAAAILDATAGPWPGDGVVAPPVGAPWAAAAATSPGELRIGFVSTSIRPELDTHPEVTAAVEATAALLAELGHRVDEDHPRSLHDPELVSTFTDAWTAGAAASLRRIGQWIGRPLGPDDVEPGTWAMATAGGRVSAPDLIVAQANQMTFRRRVAAWWTDHDLLLTPTCLQPAPRLGELVASEDDPLRGLKNSIPYAVFTSPFNVTGQPAISLPVATTDEGLPIGVQLVAAYGREDLLVQVAAQLEEAVGWPERLSPLHP